MVARPSAKFQEKRRSQTQREDLSNTETKRTAITKVYESLSGRVMKTCEKNPFLSPGRTKNLDGRLNRAIRSVLDIDIEPRGRERVQDFSQEGCTYSLADERTVSGCVLIGISPNPNLLSQTKNSTQWFRCGQRAAMHLHHERRPLWSLLTRISVSIASAPTRSASSNDGIVFSGNVAGAPDDRRST